MARPKKIKEEVAVKPRTLLINGVDGEFKITLPLGARVTFGPTIPYQPKKDRPYYDGGNGKGYSLRVYENAKNDSLVAVFAGVESFRDIEMPHAKLIIRESGKSVWKSDETGYKVETEVAHDKAFVDEMKQLESK